MKSYEFLDHTADVGVRIYAGTLKDLFKTAAEVLFNLLVENRPKSTKEKEVYLESETFEDLLVNWLNELISIFFADKFLPAAYSIQIEDIGNKKLLKGFLTGESFDPYENKIKQEIKAATYHNLKIEKTKEGYKAEIIFDV